MWVIRLGRPAKPLAGTKARRSVRPGRWSQRVWRKTERSRIAIVTWAYGAGGGLSLLMRAWMNEMPVRVSRFSRMLVSSVSPTMPLTVLLMG